MENDYVIGIFIERPYVTDDKTIKELMEEIRDILEININIELKVLLFSDGSNEYTVLETAIKTLVNVRVEIINVGMNGLEMYRVAEHNPNDITTLLVQESAMELYIVTTPHNMMMYTRLRASLEFSGIASTSFIVN